MPDRVVYLVEKLLPVHTEATLEFVDHEGLGKLLAGGYETSTTLPGQKAPGAKGKMVSATMMILKQAAENRSVSVAAPHQELVSIQDEYGRTRQVSLGEAIVESNRSLANVIAEQGRHVGHLGAPSRPNIPGLRIISGETISQAYDAGQLAAARGDGPESCPMPAGTEAATKWMQGYRAAKGRVAKEDAVPDGVTPAEHEANWKLREERCFDEGKAMAQSLGPEDVAHNPYGRSHPRLKAAWVRGFQSGGGRVE